MSKAEELIGPGTSEDTCIIIDGRLFDIGVRVVKWHEKEGFSGYDVSTVLVKERDERSEGYTVRRIRGARYGKRRDGYNSITQFMFHHTGGDGDGAARVYDTLHNKRRLSVHFVIDDDGTVFQFLDPFAKAWHAGSHNNCSVGVEMNLFPLVNKKTNYYSEKRNARTNNVHHEIGEQLRNGQKYRCFQMPEKQVDSGARLAAGVWAGLYKVTGEERFTETPLFPSTDIGSIHSSAFKGARDHVGLIGHFQATRRKIDPLGVDLYELEKNVEFYYGTAIEFATCTRS